ncbi:oxidoreductase [Muriicola sp.]|uniref:oxidoreductase n=1 Tax=Muriicola sp. TaxID=2020856 RepID=UPI003C71BD50
MDNKIWLITGISSGLGKALAESVIEKGYFVIGTFRNESQVAEFNKKNIKNAKAILLDITNEEIIETSIKKVISEYGKIDVLVNNAGIGFVGAVEETSMKEVRSVFEPNFFGTLKLTQSVLPFMRKEKNGHIVQISSHGGIKAFSGFGIYNASKFALEGFSEAMAQEVAPLGIKVSIVEPGPFRTNFAGKGLGQAESVIDDYSETAGAFRTKLKGVDGKQEGDPLKASKAIIDLVNSENPTLRLPLGKVALMTIGMKLDSVKSDLEKNRKTAEYAVYG